MPILGGGLKLANYRRYNMLTLRPLYHSTLGFDSILDDLERLSRSAVVEQERFPPHNIIKVEENKYPYKNRYR